MGGYSSEFGISVKSGETVFHALDSSLYEVYGLTLSKEGWAAVDEKGELVGFDPSQMHILQHGSAQKLDLIFNLIHGHPGEDGTLAITWEALGIPYTSCSPATYAMTFHKAWTNGVVTRLGIPVSPALWTQAGVPAESLYPALELMHFPLFVKPCRSGSSFGISRISSPEELGDALIAAAAEDEAIVI